MGRKKGDTIKFVSEGIKAETIGQIGSFACNYVKSYGRERPISMEELIIKIRENIDLIYDLRSLTFLAFYEAVPKIITRAFHDKKKENDEPYLHCAGVQGKVKSGYMYGDHKSKNKGELWMSSWRSWKNRRDKWEEERTLNLKILSKVLEKVEDYEERQELLAVEQLYLTTKRKESKKEDEEEDEE